MKWFLIRSAVIVVFSIATYEQFGWGWEYWALVIPFALGVGIASRIIQEANR